MSRRLYLYRSSRAQPTSSRLLTAGGAWAVLDGPGPCPRCPAPGPRRRQPSPPPPSHPAVTHTSGIEQSLTTFAAAAHCFPPPPSIAPPKHKTSPPPPPPTPPPHPLYRNARTRFLSPSRPRPLDASLPGLYHLRGALSLFLPLFFFFLEHGHAPVHPSCYPPAAAEPLSRRCSAVIWILSRPSVPRPPNDSSRANASRRTPAHHE